MVKVKIRVLDRIETTSHSKESIDLLVKEARSYPCFLKKSKSVGLIIISSFRRDVMSEAFCAMAKEGKAE